MNTIDINKRLVDLYFSMLKNLSQNNKLALIEKLSYSIRTSEEENLNKKIDDLYGSWKSNQSADEIIQELKEARNFNREDTKL